MSILTDAQRDELVGRLDARETQLRGETREVFARSGEHNTRETDGVPDSGDLSVADLMADLDNAHVHRNVQELRDIEDARERLNNGGYGLCADCGLEIGFPRLQAAPAARRCQVCQQHFEKTHGENATPTL